MLTDQQLRVKTSSFSAHNKKTATGVKKPDILLLPITSPNVDRFLEFFHPRTRQ